MRHLITFCATLMLALPTLASAELSQRENRAVYGADDRLDYYEVEDATIRAIGVESAAVVMSAYAIDSSDPQNLRFRANTLGEAARLCSTENFRAQTLASFCSAVLIDSDLILTAGHCVWDAEGQCPNLRFVFDMHLTDASQSSPQGVTIDDVYSCRQVVAREQSAGSGGTKDWAVIQLDRPVDEQRRAAALRRGHSAVAQDASLLMVGGPNGLPMKWDAGGRVRDPRASNLDTFKSTVDAFGGNSGSGVWVRESNQWKLAGILVSGDQDYVQDGTCNRVNQCGATGCAGENIVYLQRALDDLCLYAKGSAICQSAAECGDGFCAPSEDHNSCPRDCEPVTCGDGYCHVDEWDSCAADCVRNVPQGWTCKAWEYGSFDGCDTTCGVSDPDCDLKDASGSLGDLFNCQSATPGAYALMVGGIFALLGGLALRARRRQDRA